MKSNIAIVIPTIRPESFADFMDAWGDLFIKHNVTVVIIHDGETPLVETKNPILEKRLTAKDIMGGAENCLTNFNAGIRNLGFAYIAKSLKDIEYIITLDDDETPIGDPIQDHVDALNMFVPVSWMSTGMNKGYTRGFPYGIRDEAEVVLSHGVWENVPDWDAPTQLVLGGKRPIDFYRGPIPKGIYYPMCSMNLAFKRKMLPYIFHAPWLMGINRFDDIFTGIVSKREIDKQGWAAVTGFATVNHERASNVFKNLKNEAPGIELNETFWQGDESHPYFKEYMIKYEVWKEFIKKCKI